MNDIQKHLLKLLLEIDDICRENDILFTPEACFAYMNDLPERQQQISLLDMM